MRFKAVVGNVLPLVRMLSAMSAISTNCVIIMSPQHWKLNANEKCVSPLYPQCYGIIPTEFIFTRYLIESQASNEILLEVNIKDLLTAFKVMRDYATNITVVKLSKKGDQNAVLSFELWNNSHQELRVNVIQDVPVKPLLHSRLYLVEEPVISAADASCLLPNLQSFKKVIDRMSSIASMNVNNDNFDDMMGDDDENHGNGLFTIQEKDGKFMITIKSRSCSLKTVYSDLWINREMRDENGRRMRKCNVSACVRLKHIMKIIHALSLLDIVQSTVVCIMSNKAVTICAILNDESGVDGNSMCARLTFYVCVIVNELVEDECDENGRISINGSSVSNVGVNGSSSHRNSNSNANGSGSSIQCSST